MLIPMTIALEPDDLYSFNEVVLHPEIYHAEHADDPRDPELDTEDSELETSGKDPEIPTEPTPVLVHRIRATRLVDRLHLAIHRRRCRHLGLHRL